MLNRDRGTALVAIGLGLAIALAAVLLYTGTGASADLQWKPGAAVPSPLPPGLTVVDNAIPVDAVPDIQVWTGSQLITFGVSGTRNVGAVYEPATGRWRQMSGPPFGTVLRGPAAVWTGTALVVVGVLCRATSGACDGTIAAAAYDPEIDTWTSIDANPQPATGNGRGHGPVVGRGIGMIGADAAFVLDGQYYAFRPDSWDWDWLPAPTAPDGVACSVGGNLVLTDAKTGTFSVLAPDAPAWTTVRRPVSGAATACTDTSVVVAAPDLSTVGVFEVATRQTSESTPPPFPVTGPFVAGFTGRSVLFVGTAEVVANDSGTGTWRAAAPGLTQPPDRVAWTQVGDGLYLSDEHTLAAYNP
jgi:hypothetical protein